MPSPSLIPSLLFSSCKYFESIKVTRNGRLFIVSKTNLCHINFFDDGRDERSLWTKQGREKRSREEEKREGHKWMKGWFGCGFHPTKLPVCFLLISISKYVLSWQRKEEKTKLQNFWEEGKDLPELINERKGMRGRRRRIKEGSCRQMICPWAIFCFKEKNEKRKRVV